MSTLTTNNVTLKSATSPKIAANCTVPSCVKKVVVVLDPGHGYTSGSTGSAARIYTYNIKGSDGKPELDANGKPKVETKNILKLPLYVRDNPKKWIISEKEDHARPERRLVYEVATKLKSIIENNSSIEKVLLTRGIGPLPGKDNRATRQLRVDLAHKNKADYFISIHADGAIGYPSRSHIAHFGSDPKSLELAEDITKSYSVVPTGHIEIRKDLQVLKPTNKTSRKVLVELGFITTPKDAYIMFTNIDKMAKQISVGLIENIKKNFS